jgi:hypothetical protein
MVTRKRKAYVRPGKYAGVLIRPMKPTRAHEYGMTTNFQRVL